MDFLKISLFIYFWLCWVFIAAGKRGLLSNCCPQSSHCCGFSCCGEWPWGHAVSVVVAPRLQTTSSIVVLHGPSSSKSFEIFPDQGSNLYLLHWQEDSISHQGSPELVDLKTFNIYLIYSSDYSCWCLKCSSLASEWFLKLWEVS